MPPQPAPPRTGLWLVGARGGVATTAAVGCCALQQGLIGSTGLVTELPPLAAAGLRDWGQFVLGGCEIRAGELPQAALDAGLPPALVAACGDELRAIDQRIVPGVVHNSGSAVDQLAAGDAARRFDTPRAAVDAIKHDLDRFRESERLERVIVAVASSTEPPTDATRLPDSWEELEPLLATPHDCPLRASSLYAIAALESGCGFVNFTPSLGASCAAIDQLAIQVGACHAGRDGKTGETLLKTTLAPMFASRNLEVMSWVGHNILGNADGRILSSQENKQSKLGCKDAALDALLGREPGDGPQSLVSIEYVASLGERKTAWNHVHFRGFMGVEMTLQVTWQGHDSALAAPLVLDLARLLDASSARGERGAVGALACFFKNPVGAPLEGHAEQFAALLKHYAGRHSAEASDH
ncbi:Inositol-3-phosphate synthase [Posidoniimonas polymericola]|uniref:Inositol-3-phosphate synthase n=1 Tax=Posidoniimonas polymericola TaxID=2528002 RepID=A0A5C5ZER2_9BACT|nr:inositol-3-phosphate synthase [Posidoniimonas polymericola]TWT85645.1 Inositol-3-phosphate synthase [Posidoniimonas polymericola]